MEFWPSKLIFWRYLRLISSKDKELSFAVNLIEANFLEEEVTVVLKFFIFGSDQRRFTHVFSQHPVSSEGSSKVSIRSFRRGKCGSTEENLISPSSSKGIPRRRPRTSLCRKGRHSIGSLSSKSEFCLYQKWSLDL